MPPQSIIQTVAPTALPVDLDEVLSYLRLDSGLPELQQEALRLIERATAYAQEYQWSQLISATWAERYDRFPGCFALAKNPVSSVTSVAYVDTAGNTQTLTANTDYTVDIYSRPARIVPAYTRTWPATRGHINDVTVTYVAGYGASFENVPQEIRQALTMLVVHWQEFHGVQDQVGESVAFSVKQLLDLNSFRTFY